MLFFYLSGSSLSLDPITDLHLLHSLPAHRSCHRSPFFGVFLFVHFSYHKFTFPYLLPVHRSYHRFTLPYSFPVLGFYHLLPFLYLFPVHRSYHRFTLPHPLPVHISYHSLAFPYSLPLHRSFHRSAFFPLLCPQIFSSLYVSLLLIVHCSYHKFSSLPPLFGIFISFPSLSFLVSFTMEQSVILADSSIDFSCWPPLWPFCSLLLMENSPSLPIRRPDAPSNNLFNINSAFHDHCLPTLLSTNSPSMILCDFPSRIPYPPSNICIYGLVMSCLMNMINFYLLKGQSEFLHVKQKQLPCSKCPCAFWLIAGQVTQQYK